MQVHGAIKGLSPDYVESYIQDEAGKNTGQKIIQESHMDFITTHEPQIRLGCFLVMLGVIMAWEVMAPRLRLALPRRRRWPANLLIVALNTVAVRLVFPILPIGAAAWAAEEGWGLLNVTAVPEHMAIAGAVMVLDLAIYLQHVIFHKVPVLWRLHRMHHADTGFDVTTGSRFHPIEIMLSTMIKMAVIVIIGAPMVAVVLFEVLLNATATFNHGNIRLPLGLDRALRLVLVTPDMHRVHHSSVRAETDSNYGFNIPWWDRLFGTYRDQPALGHDGMEIGLPILRDPGEQRLDRMITQPFR